MGTWCMGLGCLPSGTEHPHACTRSRPVLKGRAQAPERPPSRRHCCTTTSSSAHTMLQYESVGHSR